MDETRARAREQGYVETDFGRRLWLPELKRAAPPCAAKRPSAPRSTRPCRAPRRIPDAELEIVKEKLPELMRSVAKLDVPLMPRISSWIS
jgi:DNA polymerase I